MRLWGEKACSLEETGLAVTIGVNLGVEAVEQGGLVLAAAVGAVSAVGTGDTNAGIGSVVRGAGLDASAAVVVGVNSGVELVLVLVRMCLSLCARVCG